MTATIRKRPVPRSVLGQMLQNTIWLIGGKSFGAICGLAYTAILTHTLGLKGYGHFSLILGTAQALVAIAGFQTWQAVVRFGTPQIQKADWVAFGRLSMLCGVLDALGAAAGCAIAFVLIYGGAEVLDLNPAFIDTAFYFCCALVWSRVSAPAGVLRAIGRFDMSIYVEAIAPLGKLIAFVIIWYTDHSVFHFLYAWAIVDLLVAVCYWTAARHLCPEAISLHHLRGWREALHGNQGIRHFFLITYTSATLEAAIRNGPVLAVGAIFGTTGAGAYRLASQLSQALSKLSTLLTRAVYAEISRARVASAAAEFRKLAIQTSLLAGGAGAVVVSVALLAGGQLLALLGGDEFARGATILIPLAIAGSFDLASVAFEPVLHSTGLARHALIARALAVVALAGALIAFAGYEAEGIAWAVATAGAVGYLALGFFARRTLYRLEHGEAVQP